jgi:hypothetical protein
MKNRVVFWFVALSQPSKISRTSGFLRFELVIGTRIIDLGWFVGK